MLSSLRIYIYISRLNINDLAVYATVTILRLSRYIHLPGSCVNYFFCISNDEVPRLGSLP